MKTYEEMAQSALSRIESCQIEKRKRRKTAALIALPVACVCLAAVLGVFAWRFGADVPISDSGNVALSDGARLVSKPADELPEPTAPKAPPAKPSDAPDEEVIEAPAKSSDVAPAEPFDTASAKPSDPAPVKPDDSPAEPKGEMPPAPEETPSEKPDEEVPEIIEEPPVKPEEEPSAEPSSGNTEEPEPQQDPTPQEDPTPQTKPSVSGSYRMEGDREYVTLTLLSTGEVEEIDVTGWRASLAHAYPAGEQSATVSAQSSTYARQCQAFGVIVMCFLSVDENNEVHVNTVTITLQQNEPLTPEASEQARAAQEAAKEAAEAAARAAQAERDSN